MPSIPKKLLAWLLPLTFLGFFFFYPLARILALSLDFAALPAGYWPRLLSVLGFTFFQALISSLFTLLLGLPLAFLFARFDFPAKALFRTLTAIPFMLPTVVVAAGFNALLGPRGWLNLGLMGALGLETPPIAFIGTIWAIFAAHVFYNATIVIRLVGDAWIRLDTRLSDAARSLGASPARTFWQVTLPLLRPAIFASSLLVFLFDFSSYGVILLLGGPRFATLEVEIYIQALQLLNLQAAALLSLIQLLCTLGLSTLYSRYILHAASPIKSVERISRPARTLPEKAFVAALAVFCIGFFALPLLALPMRSLTRIEADRARSAEIRPALTTDYYNELFINRRGSLFYVPPVDAAINSLSYASLTVVLSLLLGFPAALALTRPGPLEKWLDPFLMLPLGASAVTLGLGYIITFNKPIPLLTTFHLPLSTASLLTSPLLIPLAHTTIALPFVIRNLQAALVTIPQRYREAAAVLGASPFHVWRTVDLPIISRAVISAGAFAFTVSLGEFGAASLLARPEYPTLPTAIYRFLSQPGGMNYGQAMAMATILMLTCGLGIFLIEKLRLPGAGEL
jgi:thiamine transport system permease protein